MQPVEQVTLLLVEVLLVVLKLLAESVVFHGQPHLQEDLMAVWVLEEWEVYGKLHLVAVAVADIMAVAVAEMIDAVLVQTVAVAVAVDLA